jgi:hypothetical protein
VSAIPTQAMMPRTNRTGLMPKLGEAGPEERTICMPDFDYGAVKQARQVIPGRVGWLDSSKAHQATSTCVYAMRPKARRRLPIEDWDNSSTGRVHPDTPE